MSRGRRVRVRVPASSANLGPGFDALAAALSLHLELEVEEGDAFAVQSDLAIAHDRRNLCVRAFARLRSPDRHVFRIASSIPLAGGLGTSAAAIVAGLLAADALEGGGEDLLAHAIAQEGHPDNVAAALLGGFVVCVDGRATRFAVPPGLAALLVVPHHAVRTSRARAALPPEVPLADAVFNVGHAAQLVLGLVRGDWELVSGSLVDRLHQPRRASLYPRSMGIVEVATDLGALGATISGAGPSVLVWVREERTGAVVQRVQEEAAGWADVRRVRFEERGAELLDGPTGR
jgi:homoserine kinase